MPVCLGRGWGAGEGRGEGGMTIIMEGCLGFKWGSLVLALQREFFFFTYFTKTCFSKLCFTKVLRWAQSPMRSHLNKLPHSLPCPAQQQLVEVEN